MSTGTAEWTDVNEVCVEKTEVVCSGLPFWHGAQFAVDAVLVSPPSRGGLPHAAAVPQPGVAQLLVFGIETY